MVCNDSCWGRELVCSLHRHDQLPFFIFFCLLVAHINYCFFPFVVVIGWWCTVIGWLGFVVWYDWQKAARSGAGRPVQEAFYYSWILPGVYYESHRPSEGQGKLDVNSHGSGKWGVVCCDVCVCVCVCVCVWSNWKDFFFQKWVLQSWFVLRSCFRHQMAADLLYYMMNLYKLLLLLLLLLLQHPWCLFRLELLYPSVFFLISCMTSYCIPLSVFAAVRTENHSLQWDESPPRFCMLQNVFRLPLAYLSDTVSENGLVYCIEKHCDF